MTHDTTGGAFTSCKPVGSGSFAVLTSPFCCETISYLAGGAEALERLRLRELCLVPISPRNLDGGLVATISLHSVLADVGRP